MIKKVIVNRKNVLPTDENQVSISQTHYDNVLNVYTQNKCLLVLELDNMHDVKIPLMDVDTIEEIPYGEGEYKKAMLSGGPPHKEDGSSNQDTSG